MRHHEPVGSSKFISPVRRTSRPNDSMFVVFHDVERLGVTIGLQSLFSTVLAHNKITRPLVCAKRLHFMQQRFATIRHDSINCALMIVRMSLPSCQYKRAQQQRRCQRNQAAPQDYTPPVFENGDNVAQVVTSTNHAGRLKLRDVAPSSSQPLGQPRPLSENVKRPQNYQVVLPLRFLQLLFVRSLLDMKVLRSCWQVLPSPLTCVPVVFARDCVALRLRGPCFRKM